MARRRVAILRDAAYRPAQEQRLIERLTESGFEHEFVESIGEITSRRHDSKRRDVVALIRWEENGGLYGELRAYRGLTELLYDRGIAPVTVDFAFWDHYNGFTFEVVEKNNVSSIGREWVDLPDSVDFDSVPGKTGDTIRRIRTCYEQERTRHPENHAYLVAAFNQSGLRRCQIGKTETMAQWNSRIYESLTSQVIFKTMPSPALGGFAHREEARVVTHDANYALEQNANLAVHAKYCLTNSSGVLNEFVVTDTPVVVTGAHRYSGLGVFYEMRYWEDLAEKALDPAWSPPIRAKARAKFVHWNLRHQCLHGEASDLLRQLVDQFQSNNKFSQQPRVHIAEHDSIKRKPGRCFLTGSDDRLEDLLPWWYENLRRHHPDEPIVFADFGMSTTMLDWCGERGEVLNIGRHPVYAWHNKPKAIWMCPYETRCWLDVDCEVLATIGEVFDYAKQGLAVTEDWVRGENWEHAHGQMPVATGVVAVSGECKIVMQWAEISTSAKHRGDQESLNGILAGDRNRVCLMPREFQSLRLDSFDQDGRLIHWTGFEGKKRIRDRISRV